MAVDHIFDGKVIKRPGVYSDIKAQVDSIPVQLSYGNVLLIDTGEVPGWAPGAGIAGTNTNGLDAVMEFDSKKIMRNAIKGGLWWLLAKYLWEPAVGVSGVSKIFYVSARASLGADISFDFVGNWDESGSVLVEQDDGGTFVFTALNEGVAGNGILSSGVLSKGYSAKLIASPNVEDANNPDIFRMEFYRGTFTGIDSDGDVYADIAGSGTDAEDTTAELLLTSDDFTTMAELLAWASEDGLFLSYFKLKSSSTIGDGNISDVDLLNYSADTLASGGTETYSSDHLQTILDTIGQLDYTRVLCDKWGDNAKGIENTSILSHILGEAKWDKFLVVGGGKDGTKFKTDANSSVSISEYFDNERVTVVHAGLKQFRSDGTSLKEYDSIVKAAAYIGRRSGLAPQIPVTFKPLNMAGDMHNMIPSEKNYALDKGVLCTEWDDEFGAFVVMQDINSLQNNKRLANSDGTSYENSIASITAQLNKELFYNMKKDLLQTEEGVNRATLTEEGVINYVKKFLTQKVKDKTLIISFENVTAETKQDGIYVTYGFGPNVPVNKIFVTGVMII